MELDSDMPISDYIGEKIWFSGTIAKAINQHLMKEAPLSLVVFVWAHLQSQRVEWV